MKLTVYTAIFDDYDTLKDPQEANPEVNYICFSDTPKSSDIWNVRIVNPDYSYRKENRRYKVLAHKFLNCEYSFYVDGSVELKSDISPYIETWVGENDIAMALHPGRDCLYDEAAVCRCRKLDSPKTIAKQIQRYREEGYPEHNALTGNTFILRRHTPKIAELNELWWHEIDNYSIRDQLSFNYVVWKLGVEYSLFPFTYHDARAGNEFLEIHGGHP